MAAMLWILLPVFVAAGSALLSFYIMQARLEVAVARERASLAEAQSVIRCQEKLVEERVRATEESTMRRALEQFLGEFRVEERHYIRENRSLFSSRRSMVLQERLFFRNIPLSEWVEHEMVVEEGGDLKQLAKSVSAFAPRAVKSNEEKPPVRMLRSRQEAQTA
jgi:hypothetical protein